MAVPVRPLRVSSGYGAVASAARSTPREAVHGIRTFDSVGDHRSLSLSPDGRFLLVGGTKSLMLFKVVGGDDAASCGSGFDVQGSGGRVPLHLANPFSLRSLHSLGGMKNVEVVRWHPYPGINRILTASTTGMCVVYDDVVQQNKDGREFAGQLNKEGPNAMRSVEHSSMRKIEMVEWDMHHPEYFGMTQNDTGFAVCDCRVPGKALAPRTAASACNNISRSLAFSPHHEYVVSVCIDAHNNNQLLLYDMRRCDTPLKSCSTLAPLMEVHFHPVFDDVLAVLSRGSQHLLGSIAFVDVHADWSRAGRGGGSGGDSSGSAWAAPSASGGTGISTTLDDLEPIMLLSSIATIAPPVCLRWRPTAAVGTSANFYNYAVRSLRMQSLPNPHPHPHPQQQQQQQRMLNYPTPSGTPLLPGAASSDGYAPDPLPPLPTLSAAERGASTNLQHLLAARVARHLTFATTALSFDKDVTVWSALSQHAPVAAVKNIYESSVRDLLWLSPWHLLTCGQEKHLSIINVHESAWMHGQRHATAAICFDAFDGMAIVRDKSLLRRVGEGGTGVVAAGCDDDDGDDASVNSSLFSGSTLAARSSTSGAAPTLPRSATEPSLLASRTAHPTTPLQQVGTTSSFAAAAAQTPPQQSSAPAKKFFDIFTRKSTKGGSASSGSSSHGAQTAGVGAGSGGGAAHHVPGGGSLAAGAAPRTTSPTSSSSTSPASAVAGAPSNGVPPMPSPYPVGAVTIAPGPAQSATQHTFDGSSGSEAGGGSGNAFPHSAPPSVAPLTRWIKSVRLSDPRVRQVTARELPPPHEARIEALTKQSYRAQQTYMSWAACTPCSAFAAVARQCACLLEVVNRRRFGLHHTLAVPDHHETMRQPRFYNTPLQTSPASPAPIDGSTAAPEAVDDAMALMCSHNARVCRDAALTAAGAAAPQTDPRAAMWESVGHIAASHDAALILDVVEAQLAAGADLGDPQYCILLYELTLLWARFRDAAERGMPEPALLLMSAGAGEQPGKEQQQSFPLRRDESTGGRAGTPAGAGAAGAASGPPTPSRRGAATVAALLPIQKLVATRPGSALGVLAPRGAEENEWYLCALEWLEHYLTALEAADLHVEVREQRVVFPVATGLVDDPVLGDRRTRHMRLIFNNVMCGRCGSEITTARDLAGPARCVHCAPTAAGTAQSIAHVCVVCEQPVDEGLFCWLRPCGHGGHPDHIAAWLQRGTDCPKCGVALRGSVLPGRGGGGLATGATGAAAAAAAASCGNDGGDDDDLDAIRGSRLIGKSAVGGRGGGCSPTTAAAAGGGGGDGGCDADARALSALALITSPRARRAVL